MGTIKQLSDRLNQPISKKMEKLINDSRGHIKDSADLLSDYKIIADMYNVPFEMIETPQPIKFA